MFENNVLINSMKDRDEIVRLLNMKYKIPEELKGIVKDAIKEYATKNYNEETLNKFINTEQSLSDSESKINQDMHFFKGHVAEWLICLEYNTIKNKGNVLLTLINPDPTSKADLIHIIKTKNGFIHRPGPDVKTGEAKYVLGQWDKNLRNRYNIPMIDPFGVLTDANKRKELTKGQLKKLDRLESEFPNKKPIPSAIQTKEIMRAMYDYLIFRDTGLFPTQNKNRKFKVPKTIQEWKNFKNRIKESSNKGQITCSWENFKENTYIDLNQSSENKIYLEKSKEQIYDSKRHNKYQSKKKASEKQKNKYNNDKKSRSISSGISRKIKIKVKNYCEKKLMDVIMNPEEELEKIGKIYNVIRSIKNSTNINIENNELEEDINVDNGSAHTKKTNTSHNSPVLNEDSGSSISLKIDDDELGNEEVTSQENKSNPTPHVVSEHGQHYHTKEGLIWKNKQPYERGKKSGEGDG